MTLILAALVIVILALLVVLDRQAKLAHEDRQAHRLEVTGLLQRIQAPQVAVAQHAAADVEETRTVAPMTDEQIAEREQALAEIQDFERRLL